MLPVIIFIKGMLIGLCIAAPIGPVGILCIRTTLSRGWRAGVATGLGAAVGDGTFGAAAAFGIVLITGFIKNHSVIVRLVGGVLLVVIGTKIIIKPPALVDKDPGVEAETSHKYLASHFATTLLLTLTNPATMLSFMAVFAGVGVTAYDNHFYSYLIVAGVFSGSLLWWFILSSATFHAGKKMVVKTLHRVNLFSGLFILAFAAAALLSVVI